MKPLLLLSLTAAYAFAGCEGDEGARPDAAVPSDAEPEVDGGGDLCNPIAESDACAVGERCTFQVTNWSPIEGATDCFPDGPVEAGEACHYDGNGLHDCAERLWCTPESSDGEGTCAKLCYLDVEGQCPEGMECTALPSGFFDDVSPRDFGVCQ